MAKVKVNKSWLKYSNGYGHLIMSVAGLAVGVFLFVIGQPGYGWSCISIILAAWFVPGAAKQVAHEVSEQVKVTTAPLNLLENNNGIDSQSGSGGIPG